MGDNEEMPELSTTLIKDNKEMIDEYLRNNPVTLDNLDESLEELIEKLLTTVRFK